MDRVKTKKQKDSYTDSISDIYSGCSRGSIYPREPQVESR
jgi:hypothetical protein